MHKPATLPSEKDRLERLRAYQVLDTEAEPEFDGLTALAAQLCQTPISLVSFIDAQRQWLKSRVGFNGCQSSRDIAFCAHAILGKGLFVVPDALLDERFADNPFVTGEPHIRFYAGFPLIDEDGHALGSLCVIDTVPRQLTQKQSEGLEALARQVMVQMRLRRLVKALSDEITEHAHTDQALAASERFARSTLDALTAHVAILDPCGNILAVNRAWRDFALANSAGGANFAEGANYLAVCKSAHGACSSEAAAVADGIGSVLRGERDVFSLEYPCHSPTEKRWFVVRVSRFAGESPIRVVVAHENVTERRMAEDRLRHDSLHDALTGLPNRLLFHDRVARCLKRSQREPAYRFAVLFLDLDRFKVVNDSLGHAAGDKLLTTVAERLEGCLREGDSVARPTGDRGGVVVARMGGDEFTVLLDGLRMPTDAARVAERILGAVCRPVQFEGQEIITTASIGIVLGGPQYESDKDVLRDADAAMYKAKGAGKNRYAVFDSALHEAAVTRLRLESDLRWAVEREELVLHYQPIISLQTRELEGFEALIRWRHDGGLVNPAQFIPVAEDTGLIVPIGTWVLRKPAASWPSGASAIPILPTCR